MKIGNSSYTLPQIALLLANLIPLFGVLYLDWDVGGIIVLYWAENLVIGLYTALKMLVAAGASAFGHILFFCLHYGGFCAVHGIFVKELTEYAGIERVADPVLGWPGPMVLLEKFYHLIDNVLAAAPEGYLWVLLAMTLSHGVSFMLLYIGQGEFGETTPQKLMRAPYNRIAILHVTIIIGAFLGIKLDSPLGLLLALVALKIAMDIMLHNRSHRDAADTDADTGTDMDTDMDDFE